MMKKYSKAANGIAKERVIQSLAKLYTVPRVDWPGFGSVRVRGS
jgi:hypothetical protein